MIGFAFDTDIGSDVDDLLALALVLGSADLGIDVVTTVYGDTLLRARMARRAYRLADRPAPPIATGAAEPRSGRPVWWAGHEGTLLPNLEAEPVDKTLDAVALLRAARAIVALGPLTNVADALDGPHRVERLVIMGGNLTRREEPEHNIACDVDAAQAVFKSGVPAIVTGIDQTERVVLNDDQLAKIENSGPLGKLLVAETHFFRGWLGRPDSPHDAIAVLAAARPDLFTFRRGKITVDPEGITSLEPDLHGPHQMAADLDPAAIAEEITDRICRAQHVLRGHRGSNQNVSRSPGSMSPR
jgi:purine nucleosidase